MSKQITLHPSQKIVIADNHRFRVVNCGRQWGKTTLSTMEMFAVALSGDGKEICYIAPTFQQARDICWINLKKMCLPVTISVNESRLEIVVKTYHGGTSRISLHGWEAVETLRGQQFDFMVIDEVAMMRDFNTTWTEVLIPTLSFRQGSVLFISTPKGYNHFFDLYLNELKHKDFKSFHFSTYENPFLPKEEIERAKEILSADSFAQEYLAEFKKMQGLVYPEFNRDDCVFNIDSEDIEKIERMKIHDWFGGVDFGYTNPTVLLSVGRDHDGTFWIYDEWVHTQKTNDEMIEYAKSLPIRVYYPDPAEPDRIKEMTNAGLYCREVNKDIEKGIDTVRNLLKLKRLKVHARCVNTIAEFESYSYPDSKGQKNKNEKPVDLNNHCMDALRYVLHMLASSSSQSRKTSVHYATGAKPLPIVPRPTSKGGAVSIHYPDSI